LLVDCDGYCNDNFSDLRFLNIDEDTELPYWIENKSDGDHANVWVKIDGNSSIYMYYGNPDAISMSNGSATFSFFEGFTDSIDDLISTSGPWRKIANTLQIIDGILWFRGGHGPLMVTRAAPFGFNQTLRCRAYLNNQQLPGENVHAFGGIPPAYFGSDNNIHHFTIMSKQGFLPIYLICAGNVSSWEYQFFSNGWPFWQTYELVHLQHVSIARNVDANDEVSTSMVLPGPLCIEVGSCSTPSMWSWIDWMLIREYADTEPSWSSYSNEEDIYLYPVDRTDEILLMNSTDTLFNHAGLTPLTSYGYSGWSYNATFNVWSEKTNHGATTFANRPPMLSNENPTNSSWGLSINKIDVNITISDVDNDPMNWSIEVSTGDTSSNTNAGNGLISCTLSTPLDYITTYTWWVNVSDGSDWTNRTYNFKTEGLPGIWWDNEWQFRKAITINHEKVADDLVNFPALISFTDGDLVGKSQVDGDDLVFTNYYGEKLNHEIEYYNSSTGELVAWVNVTSLSSTMITNLYLYYGNPSCSNQENIEGTWNSDYVGVWHMNETSGAKCYDSTSNALTGSIIGDVTLSEPGITGYCYDLDTSGVGDQYVDGDVGLPNTYSEWTVEGWLCMDTSAERWGDLFSDSLGSESFPGQIEDTLLDNNAKFGAYNTGVWSSSVFPLGKTAWVYAVSSADGADSRVYWNGSLEALDGGDSRSIAGAWTIGCHYNGGGEHTDALFDEVRVSKVARSDAWISTCYNNIFSPSTFCSVGIEETVSTEDTIPPVISDITVTMSDPVDTDPSFGWENISCTVTDNVGVHSVYLNITYPDLHTENMSMVDGGGGQYYYNTTFTSIGSYGYFIWANDTSDNGNISSVEVFSIPPNWDIHVDGECNVLDFVYQANHFDEIGADGWIREDMNNDGEIGVLDLVLVSGHFDETWL